MRLVGVTGHMNLTAASRNLVAAAAARELSVIDGPFRGYSCLAAGADQAFAFAVLAAGGELVFVNPCRQIESTMSAAVLPAFRALRGLAVATIELPFDEPSNEAYEAAGHAIAATVDELLCVWDGGPSGGRGGTADIVAYRRALGRPLTVVWPRDAQRGS